jgi:hypothetical protein
MHPSLFVELGKDVELRLAQSASWQSPANRRHRCVSLHNF